MRAAVLLLLAPFAAADLPEAAAAGKVPAGAARVSLDAEGEVTVEREGRSEPLTLERLGPWLRERAAKYDEERRANGGGFAKLPGGLEASEMPVVIRADAKAPWRHVQHLMLICAEERIYRLGFGGKGAKGEEGWLPAELPVDRGAEGEAHAPPARIVVAIEAKLEEVAVWGPAQARITRPAEISFRMGETEATGIEQVRRYIRDAYQTATAANAPAIESEIRAGGKIPFGAVVAVLDEYHRAGLKAVRFRGAPAPTADERRAQRLPYPSR